MATTSYYVGSADGSITSSGTNFATVRSASSGSTYTGQIKTFTSLWKSGSTYYCRRSYHPFDTSALPDTATITSASFNAVVKNEFYGSGSPFLVLVESTQASPTVLAGDDFDQAGSTDLGDTQPSIGTAGAISIDLNSSGLAVISKTGYTQLASREKEDFDNTTPTKTIESYLYAQEETGTTNDPYLEVTYSTVTNYTLVADTMAITATFNAVVFEFARKLAVATMAVVATFNDVVLSRTLAGITLVVDTMAVTATFGATALRVARKIVADTMAVVATFNPVTFAWKRAYTLAVGTMSIIATFNDVLLRIPGRWSFKNKNTSTWSEKNKNTSSWDFKSKS